MRQQKSCVQRIQTLDASISKSAISPNFIVATPSLHPVMTPEPIVKSNGEFLSRLESNFSPFSNVPVKIQTTSIVQSVGSDKYFAAVTEPLLSTATKARPTWKAEFGQLNTSLETQYGTDSWRCALGLSEQTGMR